MEIAHNRKQPWDKHHPLYYHKPIDLFNLSPYQNSSISKHTYRIESLKATVVMPDGKGFVLDTAITTIDTRTSTHTIRIDKPADTILDQIRELTVKPLHVHFRYQLTTPNFKVSELLTAKDVRDFI